MTVTRLETKPDAPGAETRKEWLARFLMAGGRSAPPISVFGADDEEAMANAKLRAPAGCVRITLSKETLVATCDGPFVAPNIFAAAEASARRDAARESAGDRTAAQACGPRGDEPAGCA